MYDKSKINLKIKKDCLSRVLHYPLLSNSVQVAEGYSLQLLFLRVV
jgi:hypothetical protein